MSTRAAVVTCGVAVALVMGHAGFQHALDAKEGGAGAQCATGPGLADCVTAYERWWVVPALVSLLIVVVACAWVVVERRFP